MPVHLSRYEQETWINFTEEDTEASIYTHNRPLIHRLEQLAQEHPEECRLSKTYPVRRAVEYYVPIHWLRINPPRKAAPLTDEQKQQRREQLAKMRDSASKTGRARQEQATPASQAGNYISQPPDLKNSVVSVEKRGSTPSFIETEKKPTLPCQPGSDTGESRE